MTIKKMLYIIFGCIGVGLGAVGAVLPLLPAFPFLMLAAFCFARSSEKLNMIRIMIMVTILMSIGFIMMDQVPVGRIGGGILVMKKIRFEPETAGFHGVFWPTKVKSEAAMIAMLGDDSEDYMVKCCVKWFHKFGVNVMSMSPNKKDYGHHNYPL